MVSAQQVVAVGRKCWKEYGDTKEKVTKEKEEEEKEEGGEAGGR